MPELRRTKSAYAVLISDKVRKDALPIEREAFALLAARQDAQSRASTIDIDDNDLER